MCFGSAYGGALLPRKTLLGLFSRLRVPTTFMSQRPAFEVWQKPLRHLQRRIKADVDFAREVGQRPDLVIFRFRKMPASLIKVLLGGNPAFTRCRRGPSIR